MVATLPIDAFDRITALSLAQINSSISTLHFHYPQIRSLHIKNDPGVLEAEVGSVEVVPIGTTASASCRVLISLKTGTFSYNHPTTATIKVANWILAWNVDFSLEKLDDINLPSDIRAQLAKPGDFSNSHLFSLLTLVDLGHFDLSSSYLEGLTPAAKPAFESLWSAYVVELKKSSRHLFDFKVSGESEDPAVHVALHEPLGKVRYIMLPSGDKKPEHHVFVVLEMTTYRSSAADVQGANFATWVSNFPGSSSSPSPWLGSLGSGTMTIDNFAIFNQFIHDRSSFMFGEVFAMLNANFYSAMYNGAPPPTPCEWMLLGQPLGDNWNAWNPSGADTWDWRSWDPTDSKTRYELSYNRTGDWEGWYQDTKFHGTLELLPNTNQVRCEFKTMALKNQKGESVEREVHIDFILLLTMNNSCVKGKIEFKAEVAHLDFNGRIAFERHLYELKNPGDDFDKTSTLNLQMMKLVHPQLQTLITRWETSLNFDQKFVVPGSDYLILKDPKFDSNGDLVLQIQYK